MMLKFLLSAALALAVLGTAAQSEAAQKGHRHRRVHPTDYAPTPRSYGFYAWDAPGNYVYRPIGGHSYYWQHRYFPFVEGAAYNYPGHYNNQTFWERVQTQANFPVQY